MCLADKQMKDNKETITETSFDDVMQALTTLEHVTGKQYELCIKSDQWATLNDQANNKVEFIFEWMDIDKPKLVDRILAYISSLKKNS